jgi:hypothetical protein
MIRSAGFHTPAAFPNKTDLLSHISNRSTLFKSVNLVQIGQPCLRLISRTDSRRWQAFSAKLFTFSHNSQNRDPFDTQLAFKRPKAHFPDAKRRTSNQKHGRDPLIAFVTSPRASGSKPEKANLRRTRL